MVKIINPYNAGGNDIGASLAQLGQVLFGDTLGNDMRRAKLTGMEMENQGRSAVAGMYERGGPLDFNALTANAVRGGINNIGDFERFRASNVYGAESPQATNAYVGAGGGYGNTYAGAKMARDAELLKTQINAQKVFDAALATANNTPMNVIGPNGQPMVVTRSQAFSNQMQPVLPLSEAQGTLAQGIFAKGPDAIVNSPDAVKKIIGGYTADTKPDFYVYDGGTAIADPKTGMPIDAMTKQPLPQGSKIGKVVAQSTDGFTGNSSADQKLFDSRVATERATSAIDNLTSMLKQPNADQSTGYVGRAANLYTDIRSQLEAISRFAGGESVQQAFNRPEIAQSLNDNMQTMFGNAQFNERVRQLGIDNAKLQSQVIDLAYMIAKATDPGGRMSNQDIENATRVVMGSILDPQSGVAVLDDLKGRLVRNQKIYEDNLARIYPQAAKSLGAQAPAATGPASAPVAAPLPTVNGQQVEETKTVGQKTYYRIGGKWFEQ